MRNDFTPSEPAKARQQGSLLTALNHGPLSSVAAREDLGILHPAARVLELRRLGFPIITRKAVKLDAAGRRHTCAEYVLVKGGADE